MNLLIALFSFSFLFSIVRVTTPLIFGSMSSMMSEHCGISNIGIEGIMLISALTGVLVSSATGANAWLGLFAALIVGVGLGLLLGFIVMRLGTDPTIAGIAYNLTAGGATIFFLYLACGEKGNSSRLMSGTLPIVHIPLIEKIPFVGNVISGHNLLTYVAFLLVPLLAYALYRTPFGIHLRSSGENPEALESVGISIRRTRYLALAFSGLLAALGGAYMSMGYVSYFVRDMTAGRGFIAIAATALGNKKPVSVMLACLLFGVADAFATHPSTQSMGIPTELVGIIPYLVTIAALVIYSYKRMKAKKKLLAQAAG